MTDIEQLRITKIEMPDITKKYTKDQVKTIDIMINEIIAHPNITKDELTKIKKRHKMFVPDIIFLHRYLQLVSNGTLEKNLLVEDFLKLKKKRMFSGVQVIAVSTYPEGDFVGCPADCHYCPKEPEKTFNVRVINTKINTENQTIKIKVVNINPEDLYFTRVINKIYYQDQEIEILNVYSNRTITALVFSLEQWKQLFKNSYPTPHTVLKVYKTAQPRSYMSEESAVKRANNQGWDCVAQFRDIAAKKIKCGHHITKVDGIVIGGTWSYYPKDYQKKFIRDFYYAANTLYDDLPLREKKSMEEEIHDNQTTECRIIGLCLETRPDFITPTEIRYLRSYGCTRVQIGVQHTNDDILNYINRKCPHHKTIKAIKLLKDAGFKIDIHLMPDLPSSSFYKDFKMLEQVLNSHELQADQWKIYPCQTMKYTKIREWYENGTYKPYFEESKTVYFDDIYLDNLYHDLRDVQIPVFMVLVYHLLRMMFVPYDTVSFYAMQLVFLVLMVYEVVLMTMNYYATPYQTNPLFHLLVHFIPKIHPWIRLNRVVRDNPESNIVGGLNNSCYRMVVEDRLANTKKRCMDIRYREIKGRKYNPDKVEIITRKYLGSGCQEYFISIEDTDNDYLMGFIRLRLPEKKTHYLTELSNCALIRELHIYGYMTPQGSNASTGNVQHRGFGTQLVKRAEMIALQNGYQKMAIISGVGVRQYYQNKHNYKLEGTYMTKELETLI